MIIICNLGIFTNDILFHLHFSLTPSATKKRQIVLIQLWTYVTHRFPVKQTSIGDKRKVYKRGWQTFPVKGQTVHILGFAGHMVTTTLCNYWTLVS